MGTRTFRGTQTRTHARRSSTTNTKAAESSASSASSATGASIMTERVRTSELAAKPIRSRKAEAAQPAEEQQKQQPSSTHLVTPSTPTCPFLQPLSRAHTQTPTTCPPGTPRSGAPKHPSGSQLPSFRAPSTQHPAPKHIRAASPGRSWPAQAREPLFHISLFAACCLGGRHTHSAPRYKWAESPGAPPSPIMRRDRLLFFPSPVAAGMGRGGGCLLAAVVVESGRVLWCASGGNWRGFFWPSPFLLKVDTHTVTGARARTRTHAHVLRLPLTYSRTHTHSRAKARRGWTEQPSTASCGASTAQ